MKNTFSSAVAGIIDKWYDDSFLDGQSEKEDFRKEISRMMQKIIDWCNAWLKPEVKNSEKKTRFMKIRKLAVEEIFNLEKGYDVLTTWIMMRELILKNA